MGWLASGSLRELAHRDPSLGHGHQAGQGPACEEAPAEHLADVAHLVEVAADEAGQDGVVVSGQRRAGRVAVWALEGRKGRLGGQPSRLDGVVDPLEGGDVDQSGAVATEQQPGRVQAGGQRVEAAARDGLGSPLETLAAFEQRADLGVGLQLLEEVVDRQGRVAVVQAHDHPDGHLLRTHRVDERAAELPIPGPGP